MSDEKTTYAVDIAPLLRGEVVGIRIPKLGPPNGFEAVDLRVVKTVTPDNDDYCPVCHYDLCPPLLYKYCPGCGNPLIAKQ